jgi:hypothetical protein
MNTSTEPLTIDSRDASMRYRSFGCMHPAAAGTDALRKER